MPEMTPLDPFHDPYNFAWVHDVPQGLYPWSIPVAHYLGRANGCQWDGTGYHYVTREGDEEYVHLRQRGYWVSAIEYAGNRDRGPRIPTALYRVRDQEGQLLYIGISEAPYRRWAEHAAGKPWWGEVATLSLEWFECRPAALRAEAMAIRDEFPIHNIQHNQTAA